MLNTDRVDFRILGPLEVGMSGRRFRIPSGKQRILLASLLLEAQKVVSFDRLVERLWDEEPPAGTRAAVHTCIRRLRRTLDHAMDGLSALIHTAPTGYLIMADPRHLDLQRFRAHSTRARAAQANGDRAGEWAALVEGLAEWRGPVLSDVPSQALHRDVSPVLTEEWLQVLERRNELALQLGRHGELVPELRGLTARFPLQERFWQQLMTALCRSDRHAEALDAYAKANERLREDLGIDPGDDLQDLYLQILRREWPRAARGENDRASMVSVRSAECQRGFLS